MNVYILLLLLIGFIIFLYYMINYYYKYRYPDVQIITNYDYTNRNISLYNPSIVKYKDKYMCVARKTIDKSNFISKIVYSELDNQLNPLNWREISAPIPEEMSKNFKISQYEDLRLYTLGGRLFSLQTFTGFYDINKIDPNMNKMSIFELDENANILSTRIYSEFEGRHKNWYLFEAQDKNYMITDFYPLRFYEIDIHHNFDLYNKTEITHPYKEYYGTKVYSVNDNKLKCIAHRRENVIYYVFRFFEIDLENKNVNALSEDMSFANFHGLYYQYPHTIKKLDDKLIMTLGIEDRMAYVLEIKDPKLL